MNYLRRNSNRESHKVNILGFAGNISSMSHLKDILKNTETYLGHTKISHCLDLAIRGYSFNSRNPWRHEVSAYRFSQELTVECMRDPNHHCIQGQNPLQASSSQKITNITLHFTSKLLPQDPWMLMFSWILLNLYNLHSLPYYPTHTYSQKPVISLKDTGLSSLNMQKYPHWGPTKEGVPDHSIC